MLIPSEANISVGTRGMGSVSFYPSLKIGEEPEVVMIVTDREQAMRCALDPVDALRLGRALVAAGELLTRPQDRIAMEGEP